MSDTKTEGKQANIMVGVPKEAVERIDAYLEQQLVPAPRTAVVRQAVKEFIENHGL